MVDLCGNLGRLVKFSNIAGYLGAHVGKDVEVAVAQGMVEQHAIALRNGRGAPDDVYNRNVLGKGTRNAIDGGELADSKGGDESSYLFDPSVAISGISCIELVDTSNPFQFTFW
jgi:hypothetical protein